MKLTLPFLCAALVGTSAFAQQGLSQPIPEGSEDLAVNPVGEVFFGFDSAAVPDAALQLTSIVQWAQHHPRGSIVLDGSTDSSGPDAYNVRLAARRAEAVRDKLIGMGVRGDRIVMAIYGEDALRRTTDALNRRVTVWTTYEPLHAIVDSSLVRGKAVLWTRPVTYAELHPAPEAVATR
jgi:outer membrane protein OmpA-like peptidoglycan-associated protein